MSERVNFKMCSACDTVVCGGQVAKLHKHHVTSTMRTIPPLALQLVM